VGEAVGIDGARPYDLRHAFASLLVHEGRLSVVDIAAQLGHTRCSRKRALWRWQGGLPRASKAEAPAPSSSPFSRCMERRKSRRASVVNAGREVLGAAKGVTGHFPPRSSSSSMRRRLARRHALALAYDRSTSRSRRDAEERPAHIDGGAAR
jgi:hypothetical protein